MLLRHYSHEAFPAPPLPPLPAGPSQETRIRQRQAKLISEGIDPSIFTFTGTSLASKTQYLQARKTYSGFPRNIVKRVESRSSPWWVFCCDCLDMISIPLCYGYTSLSLRFW